MTDVEVLGDYLLIEKIGTGGMARTFRALSVHASTHVCLKLLHPHLADDEHNVKMFIDEATICKELNHPNVVRLFDYGKVDEHWYIAMELVLGEDLKTVLDDARERRIKLEPTLCAEIIVGLLRALDYIHNKKVDGQDQRIVHRDVTPHNLMLPFEGGVKLTDFGVAKAAFRLSRTSTGAIKGKYGYMSPEQVRSVEVDARSDVFAAGIMLHEMLTDRHLFQGESPYITIANLISMPIQPPSRFNTRVDEELDRIVLRALEREREVRYPTAHAMLVDLEEWIVRRAMAGDVADVGRFIRELYGLEQEEPQGPRRMTSEDLAAMVSQDSNNIYDSSADEHPPIRITRATGELSVHDPSSPRTADRATSRRRSATHEMPLQRHTQDLDPIAGLLDEIFDQHVPSLSIEIPIHVEDLSPESTPSGEIDLARLERVGRPRSEHRTPTDRTATENAPVELPTQEVAPGDRPFTGARISHRGADRSTTAGRDRESREQEQTREVIRRPSLDVHGPDATFPAAAAGLVSALPPGVLPDDLDEDDGFETTEIPTANLHEQLAADRSGEWAEPRPREHSTLVINPEDVQAELARASKKPRS